MEMSWILQAGVMGLHMQLRKATLSGCTSVGEGRSSGVASSGVFKSTDSRKRSSINYYFRLFKFREDKKVGGVAGRQKREMVRQEESRASCIVLDFVCIFCTNPKGKKCLSAFFCHVTYHAKTFTSTEHKKLHVLQCSRLTKDSTFLWAFFRWYIWNASEILLILKCCKSDATWQKLAHLIIPPVNVYSFVRSCSAAGEDHTATASVRVIPVIPTLLWQQARARERGIIERKRERLYTFLKIFQ